MEQALSTLAQRALERAKPTQSFTMIVLHVPARR
jgi:hypothetical protein